MGVWSEVDKVHELSIKINQGRFQYVVITSKASDSNIYLHIVPSYQHNDKFFTHQADLLLPTGRVHFVSFFCSITILDQKT